MSKKDIDLIINELKNNKIACIALTGGEPLLSKHFPYIVRKLKEQHCYRSCYKWIFYN